MSTILAANDLQIVHENGHWNLLNGRNGSAVVEASPGGLAYSPDFANARRLSADGMLQPEDVQMVVVGWAVEDQSWHLGILLGNELSQSRGSRWCGLARWRDHQSADAELAGHALANTLDKPFRLVAKPDEEPEAITEDESYPEETGATEPLLTTDGELSEVVEPDLMALPITIGDWVFTEMLGGVECEHTPNWRREVILRGIVFSVITPFFGLLSLGALITPYANVQPEFLPYVGIILTFIMGISALGQFMTLFRAPKTMVDRRVGLLRQVLRSKRTAIQAPFESLEYVLVSHVIGRKSENTNAAVPRDHIWAEIWIHIHSPRKGFIQVCYDDSVEGEMVRNLDFSNRRPLSLYEINTPAHHAAAIIAREIGIPAYVDER